MVEEVITGEKTKLSLGEVRSRLATLYSQFVVARENVETPHGDTGLRHILDQMIPLEKRLQETHKIRYRLVPVPWEIPMVKREQIQDLYDATARHRAILQTAKLAGISVNDPLFQRSARELEQWKVSFACLYSSPQGAIIVKGEQGMVHNDIRSKVWGSEDITQFRPDISGLLFTVNEQEVFVMDRDDGEGIWPSRNLGVNNTERLLIAVASAGDIAFLDTARSALLAENSGSQNLSLKLAANARPKAYVVTAIDHGLHPIARTDFSAKTLRDMPDSGR